MASSANANDNSPSPDEYDYAAIEADIRAKIEELLPGRADVLDMLEKIKHYKREFLVELYAGTASIFNSFREANWFDRTASNSFAKVVEAYYSGNPHDPLTLRPMDPRSFDPAGLTRMPYTGPDQLRPGVLVEVREGVVRVTRVGRSHNRFYYDTISPGYFDRNSRFLRKITAVYDSPRVLSARNGQEADCPICVEALVDDPVHGQVMACETGAPVDGKIVCGHKFHRFCIQDWFKRTAAMGQPRKCPTCSALVTGLRFANPEVAVAAAAGGAGSGGGGGSSGGSSGGAVGGARTRRNRNSRKTNRKTQSRKHRRPAHRSRKH
jgi:hypothetical protein